MSSVTRRGALASGLLALAGLGVFLTGNEACSTRACEASNSFYSGGEMVDDNTYESSTLDDDWLAYGPEQYIYLQLPAQSNRTFLSAEVEISPVENPNLPVEGGANNWTNASGNLVEFESAGYIPYLLPDGAPQPIGYFGLIVHNDTCATYWARIIVHFEPLDAGTDDGDAGADALDAADTDATDATDATLD